MSDQATTPNPWDDPAAQAAAGAAADHAASGGPAAPLPADKPEMLIGGAFAGGFLAAMILKRLGRR